MTCTQQSHRSGGCGQGQAQPLPAGRGAVTFPALSPSLPCHLPCPVTSPLCHPSPPQIAGDISIPGPRHLRLPGKRSGIFRCQGRNRFLPTPAPGRGKTGNGRAGKAGIWEQEIPRVEWENLPWETRVFPWDRAGRDGGKERELFLLDGR